MKIKYALKSHQLETLPADISIVFLQWLFGVYGANNETHYISMKSEIILRF